MAGEDGKERETPAIFQIFSLHLEVRMISLSHPFFSLCLSLSLSLSSLDPSRSFSLHPARHIPGRSI